MMMWVVLCVDRTRPGEELGAKKSMSFNHGRRLTIRRSKRPELERAPAASLQLLTAHLKEQAYFSVEQGLTPHTAAPIRG